MAEQNEMLKIVTPMMEHVCDHLCRFPWEIERKEDLEEVCAGCQMDKYTNDILNTYNRQGEWIPLTKQLPEPGKPVLLTIQYTPFSVQSVIKSVMMIDKTWRGYGGVEMSETPVAWMRLPEPYKQEKSCETDWKSHLMERFGRRE